MDYTTPSHTVGNDPTAVFGRRCFAYVIDFLILVVVALIFVFSQISIQALDSTDLADQICEEYESLNSSDTCLAAGTFVIVTPGDLQLKTNAIALVVAALNLVLLSSLTGGSLGKLMVGIRVVDKATFEKAGFLKHLLRSVLLVVDTFPWFLLVPLTGLILGIVSKGHRRVGDFAAQTLVVDKRDVGNPTLVPGVNEGLVPTVSSDWTPLVQPPPMAPPPLIGSSSTESPSIEAQMATPNHESTAAWSSDQTESTGVEAEVTPEVTPEMTDDAEATDTPPEDPAPQAGVDEPMWDQARDTYIQWDPKLEAWMEWSKAQNRWIPISQ